MTLNIISAAQPMGLQHNIAYLVFKACYSLGSPSSAFTVGRVSLYKLCYGHI